MRKARRHFLLIAAGVLLSDARAQTAASLEKVAPELPALGSVISLPKVHLLDGQFFDPVQPRLLVVYWWSSTCPFCALQSPELQKLWSAHQSHGLAMLTLSIDKTSQLAQAYLQKHRYSFPAAWVTPEFQRALPKPRGLPVTLVCTPSGKVLQAERGQMFAEDVALLSRWL
jgi:hypothetical protein